MVWGLKLRSHWSMAVSPMRLVQMCSIFWGVPENRTLRDTCACWRAPREEFSVELREAFR